MISFLLNLASAALPFLLSLVTGKKQDPAKQLGMDEQVIADNKAVAATQEKIDAIPYPSDGSDLDDQLRNGKF